MKSKMADFICLVVGDCLFCTHRMTLTQYPSTRLGKLFSSCKETSISFPEQSSDVFECIMRYYRGGKLKRPEYIPEELWKKELAFWQLKDM